jgi:hypothetical protein
MKRMNPKRPREAAQRDHTKSAQRTGTPTGRPEGRTTPAGRLSQRCRPITQKTDYQAKLEASGDTKGPQKLVRGPAEADSNTKDLQERTQGPAAGQARPMCDLSPAADNRVNQATTPGPTIMLTVPHVEVPEGQQPHPSPTSQ